MIRVKACLLDEKRLQQLEIVKATINSVAWRRDMPNSIIHHTKPISLADIANQAERAMAMMEQIRAAMLAPSARKSPPTFSL